MNFKMSFTRSDEKKALPRENNPLKIPVLNVGNSDNLNLACIVQIGTGEVIGMVLWYWIKNLRHGSGEFCVGGILKKLNSPKSCKLSR